MVQPQARVRCPHCKHYIHGWKNLTIRETEALSLMAAGYDNITISEQMVVSLKSVENYINSIYSKLLGKNRGTGLQKRIVAVDMFKYKSDSPRPPRLAPPGYPISQTAAGIPTPPY